MGHSFYINFKTGIRAVKGDGNCLFRALSSIVCNNEDSHQHIRRHSVHITNNIFKHFATQCQLWRRTEYGEQTLKFMLQLLSGKSKYMCVYVPDPSSSSHSWIYFNPIPLYQLTIPTQCQELSCPPGVYYFTPGDAIMTL